MEPLIRQGDQGVRVQRPLQIGAAGDPRADGDPDGVLLKPDRSGLQSSKPMKPQKEPALKVGRISRLTIPCSPSMERSGSGRSATRPTKGCPAARVLRALGASAASG